MKKIMLLCTALLALAATTGAQENDSRTLKAMMLDLDTALTVRCHYESLPDFTPSSYCHREPVDNGLVRMWSTVNGRYRIHECKSDNAQAQHIFLARLEMLDAPEIYRHPLSAEAVKIVYNFELLTGIRNSGDGDFIGWCYISHLTRNGWMLWFNENKDNLCYCPTFHVLYLRNSLLPESDNER